VKPKMILTAGPSITEKEVGYVLDAIQNGWNSNWDGYLQRFEKAFSDYVGTRFSLTTSSCTGALHLSLLGLGVGPGDEVLVPEISWVATASAVKYCGAEPVFVDVRPDTWCMDVDRAREAVTARTKAIVPVHIYGHPTDMTEVNALAAEHGLKVLEDAAPALGAEVRGRKVGGLGDVACFSFQGAKIMTTGEGGMLCTSDEALYERIHFLWDHGRDKHIPFQISEVGYKYKMSNVQAAIGLAQIERIDELVAKKRLIYDWYRRRLADMPEVALNTEAPWARSIYWMSSVVLGGLGGLGGLGDKSRVRRDDVIKGLKERGVDSRPFFPPMSSFPMFKNQAANNPVAYRVSQNGINLPSGHNLVEEDVERVCRALKEVFATSQILVAA
jgi:perosamine synthetase